MEYEKERLTLLLGLFLYLFDYGSDIYVAVQHRKNDEPWWFGLTVALIIVPSGIVNFTAIFQFRNPWSCMAAIAQLSIVARYIEALQEPMKGVGDFPLTYLLAILRYVETIAESAPQWCLQVYIMLRQRSFPSYTVVSSLFSLLSLVWSITTLEKERRKNNSEDFDGTDVLLFSLKQSGTLVLRLLSIVIFAYVFQSYVIFALIVHWLILVSILSIQTYDEDELAKSLFVSFLSACSFLFHCAEHNLGATNPKLVMRFGYNLLYIADITMFLLPAIVMPYAPPHMSAIKVIAILAATVVLIRYGAFLLYVYVQD